MSQNNLTFLGSYRGFDIYYYIIGNPDDLVYRQVWLRVYTTAFIDGHPITSIRGMAGANPMPNGYYGSQDMNIGTKIPTDASVAYFNIDEYVATVTSPNYGAGSGSPLNNPQQPPTEQPPQDQPPSQTPPSVSNPLDPNSLSPSSPVSGGNQQPQPTRPKTMLARQFKLAGNLTLSAPNAMLKFCFKLRQKLISAEVHRKLHPLI